MDAQDEDAHTDDLRDEIARVAAHDVKHMLSRSGLHEIVELARSVTENSPGQEFSGRRGGASLSTSDRTLSASDSPRPGTRQAPGARPGGGAQQGPAGRQGPGGPNGPVAPHGGSRYPMRGE